MTAFGPILAALACALAGCSDPSRPSPPPRDPQPPRRMIEPPTGVVRPLPPHAIRAEGVGPYLLGEKVTTLLLQLPTGPRIARFEIPSVVRTSVIRAEDNTILIGGDPASTATFVAVVGPEVARTESGVNVGASLDELVRALGPLVVEPDRARDPRLAVPHGMRNARAVLDGEHIAAIVVVAERPREAPAKAREPDCARPAAPRKALGSCLTAAGELVEVSDEDITVRAADGDKVLAATRVPNLVFAAALRNPADGRDELVAITRADEAQQRGWAMTVLRLDGGRLHRVVDGEPLYQLSSAQTRWIGAELRDVDLYLELTARAGSIEVGGLLTTRGGDGIRDVAVIAPVVIRRSKPAPADPPPLPHAPHAPHDAGPPADAATPDEAPADEAAGSE